ncbi:hypothetical protein [Amycolatopsis sp. NPDC052450]|uniref:hypothetical protein n=1 Tax=Amycolatopsis sp. NPDC052450 TaxID=3363937 RepID=UPI0037C88790
MPDRQAYYASTIDWSRIRAFARRVARETRTPAENGIFYTATEYQTVTKQIETKHGLFNLFTKVEDKRERVAVSKRVDVVGRHWVLEERHHHIEHSTKDRTYTVQETDHERHYVALLADGNLKKIILTETEVMSNTHGRTTVFTTHKHSLSDLSGSDVETMDFEKQHYETGTGSTGIKAWGDREPGNRLLRHAKGVGVTQALKRLLPG